VYCLWFIAKIIFMLMSKSQEFKLILKPIGRGIVTSTFITTLIRDMLVATLFFQFRSLISIVFNSFLGDLFPVKVVIHNQN